MATVTTLPPVSTDTFRASSNAANASSRRRPRK
jgi:hypothetical protein